MAESFLDGLTGDLLYAVTGSRPTPAPGSSSPMLKELAVRHVSERPIDSIMTATLAGSILFFLAEEDRNPRVTSFADAFWTVSTCIAAVSDGGGAVTPLGKYILGLVMGIGPAMQGLAVAEGVQQRGTRELLPPADNRIIDRLDRIAALLEEVIAKRPPAEFEAR